MTYIDRHKNKINGKYMFTLDWHTPDINILDAGYSVNPGQHKCGHVIKREDGNFAIQPNNRVRLWDPSYTTKKGKNLVNRLINQTLWDVEDGEKWITSDDERYDYEIETKESIESILNDVKMPHIYKETESKGSFYDPERNNEWYWKK